MSLFTKIMTFEQPGTLVSADEFMRFIAKAPTVMRWYRRDDTHNCEWLEWRGRPTPLRMPTNKKSALRFPFHLYEYAEANRKHQRMRPECQKRSGKYPLKCGTNSSREPPSERYFDLQEFLCGLPGYRLFERRGNRGKDIFFKDKFVATCFRASEFAGFLEEKKVTWTGSLPRHLFSDDALFVIVRETLFIIEVTFQSVKDSFDEKLQNCDFKRKQYQKIVQPLELKVEYVYVLNDWFKDPGYKDVLDYINSVNCHYKFNILPLAWLGLPTVAE